MSYNIQFILQNVDCIISFISEEIFYPGLCKGNIEFYIESLKEKMELDIPET